ncbi:tetratricopeptide repeat protein [Pelovirga terrestris]|uniref:Tetratricopeptide repeat protein n=1 Tax=Pelovirga terrestris TaxID=2771352 RepID=A0A8J6QVY9_9BACT|nr:tetratricopeptide repeat protein [Pelovirga terrestris]MBD1399183.1 tetratricopeptide repeat protein [Pelovirga terrestris]
MSKKQYTKAIKDFAKIVEMEPGDIRSRQKLAELYVRTNKSSEAYEQYEAIARYYSSNGFYLKAIAIYKQMQRLDPSQVAIYSRLAELNQKQGLVGNAMAEYRSLVDYYERNQLIADEIKTLEKMRDLDPDNLNVRVKLAEVLTNNDRKDEGFEEIISIIGVLKDKGDFDKCLKLYTMFLPHFPGNRQLQTGLAHTFFEKGDYVRGTTIIETLLKDKPSDPDLLRQISRGYAQSGNYLRAVATCRQLLQMDPSDLDIRETLIQCEIDNKHYELALNELEEWKDTFFKGGRLEKLKEYYEFLNSEMPHTTTIIQTLDSIYEHTGEGGKLLDIISEREDDIDTESSDLLSDSILGSVDLDIEGDEDASADSAFSYGILEDDNIDLLLEPDDEESSDNTCQEFSDSFIELEVSSNINLTVASATDDIENDTLFDLDLDEEAPKTVSGGRENLQADLEEAEFYLQQGLFADAARLCQDILAYAPESQECRHKLQEIEDQRNAQLEKPDSLTEVVVDEGEDFGFGDFDFDSELDQLQSIDGDKKKVFKTDVDEQIAADDMESHYNLGIAYREMGLHDDAISEFEKAQKDPLRYVDCLTLKGLTYSDKGDYSNAEKMFQQALASPQLEDIQQLNLGYELGLLYERAERHNDALVSYRNVLAQDSKYRDVTEKVATLKQRLGIIDDPSPRSATTPAQNTPKSEPDSPKRRVSFL